ncbi:hypothetical protein VTK26DRAFT_9261 [Humicola hyalothermophila]
MTMDPAKKQQNVIKVMIVGDSISHGREGDWTWRYRIWEWFQAQCIAVSFVGPYYGTVTANDPEPPRRPPLASERRPPPAFRSGGGYAAGVAPEFLANSDHHFAAWGRQVNQAKWLVAEQVAAHQPDICLVQLGFNDLGWRVTGPKDTLASMRTLIDQARSAKPDIKLAIANVPQRSDLPGREDLPLNTDIYNALLARWIPCWSSPESPIALVRLAENYSSRCPARNATYDGLHPNALGEYQIAQAFSRTLASAFSLGRGELAIPDRIPPRPLPTPTNFTAVSAPSGIVVTWDRVYGAYGYDLRIRLLSHHSGSGAGDWQVWRVPSNRYDTRYCVRGQVWEYQVRASAGDGAKSAWSGVVSAVADPATAPGPRDIVTRATAGGFVAEWKPPRPRNGCFQGEIDRYGVIVADADLPGNFPWVRGVKRERVEIEGLVIGHRYRIAVETWTTVGGGIPRSAYSVVVGRGVPPPPEIVRAVVVDDGEGVEISWPAHPDAAWACVWVQGKDAGRGGSFYRCETTVPGALSTSATERFVFKDFVQPADKYKFRVARGNGSDMSSWSGWADAVQELSLDRVDSLHIALRYRPVG